MSIIITGNHIDITPAIRSYIQEKFKRLEKHSDNLINPHVVLEVKKDRHKAEATMHNNKKNIFAVAEAHNMYAAIDDLTNKLERQIQKHKEKLQDHHRSEALKNNP